MAYATSPANIQDRMLRAARLDTHLYEEVEADTGATNQALLVVVIVAVCAGIGGAIAASMAPAGVNPVMALIGGVLRAILGWAVWSFVMFFVGTKIFGGTATYGELLRTVGFANSPGVLNILLFIPIVGGIIALVVWVWTLVTTFIGIRQALDLGNAKTVGTVLIGFVAVLIITAILAAIFGTAAVIGGSFM